MLELCCTVCCVLYVTECVIRFVVAINAVYSILFLSLAFSVYLYRKHV